MRILITGSTGYVGGQILRLLHGYGHTFLAPARDITRVPLLAGVEAIPCDLSQSLQLIPQNYDAVIHIAAHAPPRADNTSAHLTHNLLALNNLITHALVQPNRPFIFFSSISTYGEINTREITEATPLTNPGSYGLSKRLGELLVQQQHPALPAIILRLPGLIGPSAPPNGVWLARIRQKILSGEQIELHSPETPFNNLVHLADLATFIERLLKHTPPTFDILNLASANPLPLLEVVQLLASHLNRDLDWRETPASRSPFTISSQKAREHYGYTPMTVSEALHRFARE